MKDVTQPHIQLEASWCVATIATGYRSQIENMVSKGLFESLIIVLSNPYEAIFEQGAWIVANVAAEDFKYKRDMIENMCHVPLINKLEMIEKSDGENEIQENVNNNNNNGIFGDVSGNEISNRKLKIKKNNEKVVKYTVWALSNLLRGGRFHYCQLPVSPIFLKTLLKYDDIEIISNCLIPIADIIEENLIEVMTRTGVLKRLKEISKFKYDCIIDPLVRILRHFSSSPNERYIDEIIKNGLIDSLFDFLKENNENFIKNSVKKEILWLLSNITVGPDRHIGEVLKQKENFDLIKKFCYSENFKLRKEALFCLACITNNGTFVRKRGLLEAGIFEIFKDNLEKKEEFCEETLAIMVEAMGNILEGEMLNNQNGSYERLLLQLEDIGIFDALEKLQRGDSNTVYLKVCDVVEKYLGEEEEGIFVGDGG